MKRRRGLILFALLLFLAGCVRRETEMAGESGETGQSKKLVELYYFSPCESCRENEKFAEAVRQAMKEAGVSMSLDFRAINAFQETGRTHMEERMEALGTAAGAEDLPAAVMDDTVYFGSYQEIGKRMAEALTGGAVPDGTESVTTEQSAGTDDAVLPAGNADTGTGSPTSEADTGAGSPHSETGAGAGSPTSEAEAGAGPASSETDAGAENQGTSLWENVLAEVEDTDTVLLLFTTFSCDSCEQVKEYFSSNSVDGRVLQDTEGTSRARLLELNILEEGGMELLDVLLAHFRVPSNEQQVPIVFYKNGYLSGEKAILGGTEEILKSGENAGTGWLEEVRDLTQDAGLEKGDSQNLGVQSLLRLFGTGLLNGLNPCAASMLLMVLSILLMNGKGFWKGSLTYMAGKLIAYTAMGMGVFGLFHAANGGGLRLVQDILTWIFALLALVLSLLNLWDYRNTRRKEYGKVVVQLPKGLRDWNHKLIGGLKKIPPSWLLPALLALGLVISAGEFFCTGQLYVATIYSMSREAGLSASVCLQLLLYVAAMCIPQMVLILVIGKTGNLLSASRFTLEGMPVVKLIYAVVFFLLFLSLAFF